jgi:hypothetical protein
VSNPPPRRLIVVEEPEYQLVVSPGLARVTNADRLNVDIFILLGTEPSKNINKYDAAFAQCPVGASPVLRYRAAGDVEDGILGRLKRESHVLSGNDLPGWMFY